MIDEFQKYTVIALGNITTWIFTSVDYFISIIVGIFTLIYVIKQIQLSNIKKRNERHREEKYQDGNLDGQG